MYCPSSNLLLREKRLFQGCSFYCTRLKLCKKVGSQFCLSRELEPVFDLLSSWKKLELDSWPVLLDEDMDQCENNAGKATVAFLIVAVIYVYQNGKDAVLP